MTWVTEKTILHTKFDIMERASFVLIGEEWCHVWGYDSLDDTLSAEDAAGKSHDLSNALESIPVDHIRIATGIVELDTDSHIVYY